MFLARLLDVPELEMSEEDATRFTEAYREVRRHFPVPAVDPKWVALGTFAYVAYGVYAPRVTAVAAKKRGKGNAPKGNAPKGNAQRGAPADPLPADPLGVTLPQTAMPEAGDWFGGTA